MTFRFPIEIAKDLVAVTGQFSKQSMEVHGIGLVSSFPVLHLQQRTAHSANVITIRSKKSST